MFISPRALHQTLHNYEIFICYDLNLQVAHICHFTIKTLVGAGVPLFKLIQRLLVIWKMAVEENRNVCQETIIRTGQSQTLQARATSCAVTFVARCLSGTEYSLRRCQCPRNNLLVTAHVQKYLESFTVCSTP